MKFLRFFWNLPLRIGTMSAWTLVKIFTICLAAGVLLTTSFLVAGGLLMGPHFQLVYLFMDQKMGALLGQQIDLMKSPHWAMIAALSAHERFVLDVSSSVPLFLLCTPRSRHRCAAPWAHGLEQHIRLGFTDSTEEIGSAAI